MTERAVVDRRTWQRVAKAKAEGLAAVARLQELAAALRMLHPEAPVAVTDVARELRAAVERVHRELVP